ncbi:hypothetical protein DSECCO2_608620 [anaerobic digester metagenome]
MNSVDYDIKARLRELGLKQIDFIRMVDHLVGSAPSPVTVTRWAKGMIPTPALAAACVELLSRLSVEAREELVQASKRV